LFKQFKVGSAKELIDFYQHKPVLVIGNIKLTEVIGNADVFKYASIEVEGPDKLRVLADSK